MFLMTTTYILRDSTPNYFLIFGLSTLIYLALFLYAFCKLKYISWTRVIGLAFSLDYRFCSAHLLHLISLICLILNMSLMFLPSNEPFVAANLNVLGCANVPTWVTLGAIVVYQVCIKPSYRSQFMQEYDPY